MEGMLLLTFIIEKALSLDNLKKSRPPWQPEVTTKRKWLAGLYFIVGKTHGLEKSM